MSIKLIMALDLEHNARNHLWWEQSYELHKIQSEMLKDPVWIVFVQHVIIFVEMAENQSINL